MLHATQYVTWQVSFKSMQWLLKYQYISNDFFFLHLILPLLYRSLQSILRECRQTILHLRDKLYPLWDSSQT